jgi:hypothetical protein
MLHVEAEFVGLKIYFIVFDALSMDFVLLWFHSYENYFCCVGAIVVLSLFLSCCKLRLTLVYSVFVVIPSDHRSIAYLASIMDTASRIGSIELWQVVFGVYISFPESVFFKRRPPPKTQLFISGLRYTVSFKVLF